MRLILILLIALALTIAWQTSVMADLTLEQARTCSEPMVGDVEGQAPEDDKPKCG